MSAKLQKLRQNLEENLGARIRSLVLERGELTLELASTDYLEVMQFLRDDAEFGFEVLVDLCGVDYVDHPKKTAFAQRFAVVIHLLSLANNWRLRVRVFVEGDDELPQIPTLTHLWKSVDWYEREAFDLLGIVFVGHEDLRRILTDYDFSGHPLRKDFPVSGHVEVRYDPEQTRVVYQPVSIVPRNDVPRVVRESAYGDASHE